MSQPILRHNYRPPAHLVEAIDLTIQLDPAATLVTAKLTVVRNPANPYRTPLMLDGDDGMELLSASIDGKPVSPEDWFRAAGRLNLGDVGERAVIEIVTRIAPDKNTELEGLFVSNGIFCTQCEAEGFRRITFFPDRPDVMAQFKVRLEGSKATEPVLLVGGNVIDKGDLPAGRHYVTFEDTSPKPAYLFAAVGGDLDWHEDSFTTMSGRAVALRIYVDRGNAAKTLHAMASLKAAMRWDEEIYGREYHLDVFNIVAVNDFTMGGMENTGLNIFNAGTVLADGDTATDRDFTRITDVVGHEYFHNWTGNLVTVRDWFQLTLKEGFTTFRELEFAATMNDPVVTRLQNVELLKRLQFMEDAGPIAQPIRPDAYVSINNLISATTYEKGAEVVRMLPTLLGRATFRRGTDLFFSRYRGQAVTCEDFIACMEEVSGRDLAQFRRWYSQSGTPVLTVTATYDSAAATLTLDLQQQTLPTQSQPEKLPLCLPVRLGLLAPDGAELPVTLAGETAAGPASRVLEVTEARQCFVLVGLPAKPVVSLLRGFSAPVKLEFRQSEDDLRLLLTHDSDGFNRGLAAKTLAALSLRAAMEGQPPSPAYLAAMRGLLNETNLTPALAAEMLTLPQKAVFVQDLPVVEVEALNAAFHSLRLALATELAVEWERVYHASRAGGSAGHDQVAAGRRSLQNLALSYLTATGESGLALAAAQYRAAETMTDRMAALGLLIQDGGERAAGPLADFYRRYQAQPLVVDKWFAVQAGADLPDRLAIVQQLVRHPAFSFTNPNKVRAVIRSFATPVSPAFHAADGAGYAFLREIVATLDRLNAQMAAFMVAPLLHWRRYDPRRQKLMQGELATLRAQTGLSHNVAELVGKSLDDAL